MAYVYVTKTPHAFPPFDVTYCAQDVTVTVEEDAQGAVLLVVYPQAVLEPALPIEQEQPSA
jgi:hypothetical protein